MAKKIIQTTPDIGVKIKLQRLMPEVDTAPALVFDPDGNTLAILGPGETYTCTAICLLSGLRLLNFPSNGEYDRPTVVYADWFNPFDIFVFPEGNFYNTDIAWSWSWDGDDLSQWIGIDFDDQLPGLLSAYIDAFPNEVDHYHMSTLTISAVCSNGSSASVSIDFLVVLS
jgi:hypothetical protein